MEQQLKSLIDDAQTILVTTHISPDPDALCSLLLMGTTLIHNYSDKTVVMSVEELTGGLKFLTGYEQIKQSVLFEAVQNYKPDLIIIVDAMSYARCTRGDAEAVKAVVSEIGTKLVIIDHHEPEGRDETSVYINQNSPAAVQDVYEVCFEVLKLDKPQGYARTVLLGLYSDTGGFIYENSRYRKTLQLLGDLLEAGESIEQTKNMLDQYSVDSMLAFGQISSNVKLSQEYVYSAISDEFIEGWKKDNKNFEDIHLAVGLFANHYLRNIQTRKWGFIVYPDMRAGPGCYGVSFRSVAGARDVAVIANRLGGGGHKPAAGAKFSADNIDQATSKIMSAIEDNSSS